MNKLTSAQLWLAHSLELLAFSAAVALGVGLYQAVQSGTLTPQTAITIGASVLIGVLGNGLKGLILNANTLQAVEDTIRQTTQSQPTPPPVIINNHIPPAPPAQAPQPPRGPIPLPEDRPTAQTPAVTHAQFVSNPLSTVDSQITFGALEAVKPTQ